MEHNFKNLTLHIRFVEWRKNKFLVFKRRKSIDIRRTILRPVLLTYYKVQNAREIEPQSRAALSGKWRNVEATKFPPIKL